MTTKASISAKKHIKRLNNNKKANLSKRPNIEQFRKQYGGVLGPYITEFCVLKMLRTKKKRLNYTSFQKWLAANVFVASGQNGYRLFRALFPSPCPTTLKDYLQRVKAGPGITKHSSHMLKMTVSPKNDHEKLAWIVMDEMSIKPGLRFSSRKDLVIGYSDDGDERSQEVATICLVVQVVGITKSWEYNLAYFFNKSTFKANKLLKILKQSISAVECEGFKILGVTTDMGSNFESLFSKLGVTEHNPMFKIEKNTYLVSRDPPHLIKLARNYLLKDDVSVPGFECKASWHHVKELLSIIQRDSLRIAPKLTDEMVSKLAFASKMKVRFATQVLSNTVAASLETLADERTMAEDAYATSIYCKNFNDLFDTLNSSFSSDSVELRRPLCEGSKGVSFLTEALKWLEDLQEINNWRKPVKFIGGFRQTIRVILMLLQNLREHGLKYLSTRHICQDSVELFFGRIRSVIRHPTAAQFEDTFSNMSSATLMEGPLRGNCEETDSMRKMKEKIVLYDEVS